MTKPVIVTRANKGAPLTRNELDANFTNIDNATLSVSDGTNTKALSLNDTLKFDSGVGITAQVSPLTGDVTITNSSPDQTVAISAGSGIGVSGTYPNFTITNSRTAVTNVSGTGTVSGISLSGSVSDSGNLTLSGALDLSSPPAIGSTTASTVRGTTITATTAFSGPHNGTVGATIPSTGAFTTLSANSTVSLTPAAGSVTITSFVTGSINGVNIGATTPGTGAFTTLSANTVNGTGFSSYLASPPAIGSSIASTGRFTTITSTTTTGTAPFTVASTTNVANLNASSLNGATFAAPGAIGGTTASTGAFTTLTTSGAITGTVTTTGNGINITYNPSTGTGAAIQATGKDSQGGTGYFDFLKTTNTTSGVTNANKSFRLSSTGDLQIINSAYTTTILSLTDAGALTIGGTTLPTSTGTNGQVLTANGSGGSSWTSASGGGNNIIKLGSSQLFIPSTTTTIVTSKWTTISTGGVSNVSVSGTNNTITLPAGTYFMQIPSLGTYGGGTGQDFVFYNISASSTIASITNGAAITIGGSSYKQWGEIGFTFTLASSSNVAFYSGPSATTQQFLTTGLGNGTSGTGTAYGIVVTLIKTA